MMRKTSRNGQSLNAARTSVKESVCQVLARVKLEMEPIEDDEVEVRELVSVVPLGSLRANHVAQT